MGARMAAARPSGILALSLFDRNVTASDPNIFFGDKCHRWWFLQTFNPDSFSEVVIQSQ